MLQGTYYNNLGSRCQLGYGGLGAWSGLTIASSGSDPEVHDAHWFIFWESLGTDPPDIGSIICYFRKKQMFSHSSS